MGAQSWTYELEHSGDIETAIQSLHNRVLHSDDLIDLIGAPKETVHFARQMLDSVKEAGIFSPEVLDGLSDALDTQMNENQYVSVDIVRLLTAERLGTGTVLDIDTASGAEVGVVEEMTRTKTPGADQIRVSLGNAGWFGMERGSAVFLRAADSPDLFFFGKTGD